MKLLVAVVILVAGFALATTAEATPTKTKGKTKGINATLVGTGCGVTGLECGIGGGGSCICLVAFWNFAGQTNISPPLGALSFTGRYSEGNFCSEIGPLLECLVPVTYVRSLTLAFTAANGDKLVLAEDFSSTTRPLRLLEGDNPVGGAWSVDPAPSTGRFTRYSGSGTYTLTAEFHENSATFSIALAGSLTFQRRTTRSP